MSDLKTLRELADLAAQSEAVKPEFAGGSAALAPDWRPARPRVAELLGRVIALSARTRRLGRDPVEIDLDVFGPDGRRAVQLMIGDRG